MIKNKQNFNLSNVDLLILDMDGVLYRGSEPVEHAVEAMERYYKLSKKIAFYTNNSTSSREAYVKKISSMNIQCHIDQIYTSSIISAKALSKKFGEKSITFAIGEDGLLSALKEYNIQLLNKKYSLNEIIQNSKIRCDFVIAGLDRNITYNKLAAATQLINRGAEFYATNEDSSLPCEYGFLPGAGPIVKAISVVTKEKPFKVFGKPSPEGILQIIDDYKVPPDKAIMIGDRPETDILSAKNAGINSALVLTGVTNKNNISDIPKSSSPDLILKDLSEF